MTKPNQDFEIIWSIMRRATLTAAVIGSGLRAGNPVHEEKNMKKLGFLIDCLRRCSEL